MAKYVWINRPQDGKDYIVGRMDGPTAIGMHNDPLCGGAMSFDSVLQATCWLNDAHGGVNSFTKAWKLCRVDFKYTEVNAASEKEVARIDALQKLTAEERKTLGLPDPF